MWESWPSWILQVGWAELGMRNALSAAWGPHHAAGSDADRCHVRLACGPVEAPSVDQ